MSVETHLQMIQGIVTRMGQNSFSLKGWVVTLTSAVFALASAGSNASVGFVALLPAVAFWVLDAYYLWQERRFVALYEAVATNDKRVPPFSMNTSLVLKDPQIGHLIPRLNFLRILGSRTQAGFYLPLIVVIVITLCILGAVPLQFGNDRDRGNPPAATNTAFLGDATRFSSSEFSRFRQDGNQFNENIIAGPLANYPPQVKAQKTDSRHSSDTSRIVVITF